MIGFFLFIIVVCLSVICSILFEIKGDTTFQWQMQKELLLELQAIRKHLEERAAVDTSDTKVDWGNVLKYKEKE